jgi:glycerol-3-phosphate acyltransferase PlsY
MELKHFIFWMVTGYFSGAIPWSLICSKFISGKDPRNVGDKNPGATNAWKVGGWVAGMSSLILDIGKGFVPIAIVFYFLDAPVLYDFTGTMYLCALCCAPIVGHAWSPILKFRGGKALAVSWGVWIALTAGGALPLGIIILLAMHLFQNNHALTVTVCLVFFGLIFAVFGLNYLKIFWILNLAIIVFKLRGDYIPFIAIRPWLIKLTQRLV